MKPDLCLVERVIPWEVGFVIVITDEFSSYAFGLWCADGYWWSSSVGITNINPELVIRFSALLKRFLSDERFKLRIYLPEDKSLDTVDQRVLQLVSVVNYCTTKKLKQTAYQLYVNSRPLKQAFFGQREALLALPDEFILAYFAGRFDGDGSVNQDRVSEFRIVYSNREEALVDQRLLMRIGVLQTSVYNYSKANTFCLYVSESEVTRLGEALKIHSWKWQQKPTP